MNDSDETLPSDIEELASKTVKSLLPEKFKNSKQKCITNVRLGANRIEHLTNEKVLLPYFNHLSKNYKPLGVLLNDSCEK